MDDPYPVEVLHIVNPHLIFVESHVQKGVPIIQQVGIYGVLPVYKTIDIDGEIIAERCENWPLAANTVLREFLAENKNHVFFVPIHVDERTTIFDENIHQFGDIIIKHRTTKISITDHLLELAVAVKDEPAFYRKLSSGSLKLKLNTTRADEVLKAIEKYYQRQRKVDHDWQKTLKKQTSIHQETKKLTELTEENLRLLERSSQVDDVTNIKKAIEKKEKDLNLCKDADLVSIGRGTRHTKSRPTSVTPKRSDNSEYSPREMFSSLKQLLATHGKKKDINNDSSKLESNEIGKQSTPKKAYEKQKNIRLCKSINSDDEWDDIDYISQTKHPEESEKNEQPHNVKNDSQSQEIPFEYQQQDTEEQDMSKNILNSDEGWNRDQNSFENIQSKTMQSDSDVLEKSLKENMNLSIYEEDEVIQHRTSNKAAEPLKLKERRLAYCPDMEMNSTNLKNLVTITINENSAANYGSTVEEKTIFDREDSNLSKNIVNDGHGFEDDISNVSNKIAKGNPADFNEKETAKVSAVTNTGSRLNTLALERKLQPLKSLNKNDEKNSISSNSDASYQKANLDSNPAIKPKNFGNENIVVTQTNTVSHSKSKNTKSLSKVNGNLSSSILLKKLQALKDLQQKNKEYSSSSSDTSVKDSSSSTERSKFGSDKLDHAKTQLKSVKRVQLKLAENVSKHQRNVNPFKNLDGSKSVFVEKLVTPILMVHTKNNNLILPQCEIRDVPFKSDIRMMLKSMRIQKPKRLQTVTWHYILRGHSMFIIGPAGNGKTVGYVPAVCNLVVDSSTKFEGVGPICIIVCATALSVSEVESQCKRFLGVEERIVTFFPGMNMTKTTTALLNGCHVLICTAPALTTLLETDFGVDLRRLSTLVLDDCERLSQVYTTEIAVIIQNVKVMQKNRADKALKVQYIVASRQWCDFMTPLARKAPDTVIAIGASQECVLYSKTNTSVNFVKSQANKVNTVVQFLEGIDRTKRKVIVCRENEEVTLLENTLTSQKHVVFACNNTMDLHDLCRLNEAWANYQEPVLGPILICCDGNLTHLNITNANYLVHFSMPALFSMFCKRFSVLNENYTSTFGPEKDDVKIKILLDETNVEQLPKILHFVKRCTKEAFPNLDNVLQKVLEANDLKKAENLNPICNNLLMLGECIDVSNCSDRHTVFKEFDEPKDWMPKQGLITFKITHYDSAVTYSARVLSKMTKTGPVKYPNNYNTLSLKMGMYYSKEINRKLHGVPKVGDVCAVALKPNFFERCRVLKVFPNDRKNAYHVLINLIEEEQMTIVSDVLLYYLPGDLKAIETHVVKVRLANIQPRDRDITFSLAAKEHLYQMTDREREHGLYIRGQVVMTLGNTIFVDTAEACVDLSSLGETVVKRDFKKELLDHHAEPNPQHIEKLKKIGGITSTIDVNEPKVAANVQIAPKWAHLDKDDFSAVILAAVIDAGTIFLRQAKFQKVVELLLKDIKEYVEKAPEIDQKEIYVGSIVLAEFPDDATYERARIDKVTNDKTVNCFFVDNGDWRDVAVNKLKTITANIMHRIPFQAIECRLVGVKPPGDADAWPEFSTYWLDDNCFEDKDGNQKQLFVKYFTKEAATGTGGHKYGVVLFDTYSEEDVVVNKMMIELNLAKVIEDEEKYIDEPLNIKRVKLTDSSSDNSDEEVTEKDNSAIDNGTPVVKDLVPFQHKESETGESNDIPLHILLGKPIRSVPLVNSDSESDISDKWDVNVDKDLLGMFGQPSKANITKHEDVKDVHNDIPSKKTTPDNEFKTNTVTNTSKKEKTCDKLEKDFIICDNTNEKSKESSLNSSFASINDIPSKKTTPDNEFKTNTVTNTSKKEKTCDKLEKDFIICDNTNEKSKESSLNSSFASINVIITNENQKLQPKSPSLDSDDFDITDERVKELNVFRRKIFKEEVPEILKNDTLDSDDLSSIAAETSAVKVTTEWVDPPRKPKIVWRQNKNTITMKINLIGVEDYTLEIKERYIKFQTWHNDTPYEFEFDLYGVVIPEKCVHANKGQYIQARLVKIMSRNWLSLTKDLSTKKWIVYDVDALEFASDVEEDNNEEARKVIKHNHEKKDSSSEDEDFNDDMNFKYKKH